MRMGGNIAMSVNILSLPGNQSPPCPMSMASSTRFLLAELTAFIETSESTFAFPVCLKITFLPSVVFMSLILSINIFYRFVFFRVLDRYTTSSLPSCGVAFKGEFASLSSVAESIKNCSISLHTRAACPSIPASVVWRDLFSA